MKLNEYVKQTLADIAKGVSEAKAETRDIAAIAPATLDGELIATAQMVSFEIVVSIEKDAGGGINVLSLGSLKGSVGTQNTNKLSFDVPVYFQTPI